MGIHQILYDRRLQEALDAYTIAVLILCFDMAAMSFGLSC